MKITKKPFVLCLAMIMLICCIMPTYSWYNHDGNQVDRYNKMEYTRKDLPISSHVDGLVMTSRKGIQDKYGEVSYTQDWEEDTFTAFGTASPENTEGKNMYTSLYETTIKNTSKKNVTVGLFLESTVNKGDSLTFGTSKPIWRRITSDTITTLAAPRVSEPETKRIYVNKGTSTWNKFYVVAHGVNPNIEKIYTMKKCPGDSNYYYADLSARAYSGFISCDAEYVALRDDRRTEEVSFENAKGRCFELSSGKTDEGYTQCTQKDDISDMIRVHKYKTGVYVNEGKTTDVSLGSDDYSGESVSYESQNELVATVDSSTGIVTGMKEGTAVIQTTITGVKGDKRIVETTVNVKSSTSTIPLVQNILVPAGKEAVVCWYIDSKDADDVTGIELMLTL